MEDQLILLDTNIFIDYFRKQNKERTAFHRLSMEISEFAISVVTHFEILRGINESQSAFWMSILKEIEVISYFPAVNYTALEIQKQLKLDRKSISFEDLLIAATAVHHNLALATLNTKHFNAINGLRLIDCSK